MKSIIIFALILLSVFPKLNAKENKYKHLINKNDTIVKDIRLYGGLIHQHEDFFNKAFSYQGVESGVIINHKVIIGAYYSTFVSNLNTKISNNPMFVNSGQGGIVIGGVRNDLKVLHTGWLLNMGYFSLKADDTDLPVFQFDNPSINISGIVLTPQVFAELNLVKFLKLRTGLAYSFFSFENQSLVQKSDLNNISFTFGFIFGNFE